MYINKQTPTQIRDPVAESISRTALQPTPQYYKGPRGGAGVVDKVLLTSNEENHAGQGTHKAHKTQRWGTSSLRGMARKA